MARRKAEEVIGDGLAGTVEGLARDHFEREKAAYEARTGETVNYYKPVPLTRTPIGAAVVETVEPVDSAETQEVSAEGDE